MCVKDPDTGKWIDCHATGARRSDKDARVSADKALMAVVNAQAAQSDLNNGEKEPSPSAIQSAQNRVDKAKNRLAVARFHEDVSDEGFARLTEQKAKADDEALAEYARGGRGGHGEQAARVLGIRHYRAQRVREQQDAAEEARTAVHKGTVGDHTKGIIKGEQLKYPESGTRENPGAMVKGPKETRYTIIGAVSVDEPDDASRGNYDDQHQVQPGIYPVRLEHDQGGDRVCVDYDTVITKGRTDQSVVGKSSQVTRSRGIEHLPGSYAPGVKFGHGRLVLRQGVKLDRTVETAGSGATDRPRLRVSPKG